MIASQLCTIEVRYDPLASASKIAMGAATSPDPLLPYLENGTSTIGNNYSTIQNNWSTFERDHSGARIRVYGEGGVMRIFFFCEGATLPADRAKDLR